MPSHQIRVKQNNCDHLVMKVEGSMGISQICIKCGKTIYIDKK